MAFSEGLKVKIRKRAHNQCCMCEAVGVDIHHVIPQKDGGPDTEANAAPLCPNCHRIHGDNPKSRKLIRERCETWYEICEARTSGPQLAEFLGVLGDIPTKADLQLALSDSAYVLGRRENQPSMEQLGSRLCARSSYIR